VIDHDSDHIDFLRKLGIKAFYGDAKRRDLLEAAGAQKAKLIIIALDEEDKVAELIETVRKHFPHLKILVRALSRPHQFGLVNQGVTEVVHQHAGSAIELARRALVQLGFRAHRATRLAQAFITLDRKATLDIAAVHKDESAFVSQVRRSISEMEDQFADDRQRSGLSVNEAWDTSKIREETAEKN
jgi:CPA2 family monovalent cation:H+ antiporter-2